MKKYGFIFVYMPLWKPRDKLFLFYIFIIMRADVHAFLYHQSLSSTPTTLNIIDMSYSNINKYTSMHIQDVADIACTLLRNDLQIECKHKRNQAHIDEIIALFKSLPPILDFIKQKTNIPEFEKILPLETDTNEIKQYIRKVNNEMYVYSCCHKEIDEAYNAYNASLMQIYESKVYKELCYIVNIYAAFIYHILYICEERNYECTSSWTWSYTTINYVKHARKLHDLISKLNEMIYTLNASINTPCHKCKAAVKQYNLYLENLAEMRNSTQIQDQYINESSEFVNESSEVSKEPTDTFESFIKGYFDKSNRWCMSEIRKKYIALFKSNITIKDLQTKLEGLNDYNFKFTRCQNIPYVTAL